MLFADVAGSTRLYEQLGDVQALATIGRCLALVQDASRGHGGRPIKTIGDEAMVVFPTADQAAAAAAEIQHRMSELARTDNLRVTLRVGFHFGAAIEADGDVFGDSVNVAARMVALAKSGQIILSALTAEALSPSLRGSLRELDVMTVKGKQKDIAILELLWQDSAELTALVTRPKLRDGKLELRHGARAIQLDSSTSSLTLGRDTQNDVVLADPLASRLHAKIERRRDNFVLIDQSSNGTFVTIEGEDEIHLRREELRLRGRGHISFGHPCVADSVEMLTFACIEGER
ncbi:MAG: adenylate/guanylate cyclase domain-containing protein [Betaproteobacteria bacterium]|nr:adenylate/guanylate cyclase domain-containing protein [Betaproteobacteria bacterium]